MSRRLKPSTKQIQLARLVLRGLTYEQIAKELEPGLKNPRQAIYNRIQRKGTQLAIQREMNKMEVYSPSYLKQRLQEVLENPEDQAILIRAIELGMKSEAMLTEKRENFNTDRTKERQDLEAKAAELALEMVKQASESVSSVLSEPKVEAVNP